MMAITLLLSLIDDNHTDSYYPYLSDNIAGLEAFETTYLSRVVGWLIHEGTG